jgi:hypothetical protein
MIAKMISEAGNVWGISPGKVFGIYYPNTVCILYQVWGSESDKFGDLVSHIA